MPTSRKETERHTYYNLNNKSTLKEEYKPPTLLPEGIKSVHKKWAIEYRNKFMVNECDTVICYVKHDWGWAWKFMEMAKRKKKRIINLIQQIKQ